jgi:hypothetical protein
MLHADRELITNYRRYLFPLTARAEDAIIALEVALQAIEREEKRNAEVAEREDELRRRVAQSDPVTSAGHGERGS